MGRRGTWTRRSSAPSSMPAWSKPCTSQVQAALDTQQTHAPVCLAPHFATSPPVDAGARAWCCRTSFERGRWQPEVASVEGLLFPISVASDGNACRLAGLETAGDLTAQQLRILCAHRWGDLLKDEDSGGAGLKKELKKQVRRKELMERIKQGLPPVVPSQDQDPRACKLPGRALLVLFFSTQDLGVRFRVFRVPVWPPRAHRLRSPVPTRQRAER